jgi:predicted DNA-binding WGR domain protein
VLVFTEATTNAKGERSESNKYYDGKITHTGASYIVETRWGRIGAAKGQSQKKEFNSEWEAKYALDDKLREKREKGYREISDAEYKTMVAVAQLVGLNNKVISTTWMERIKNGNVATWIGPVDELRLQDPACFPGLQVAFNDRKTDKVYLFLFTSEGTYVEIDPKLGRTMTGQSWLKISDDHPLSAVANSVHTAVFSA